MNNLKLSKRAETAWAFLEEGGFFRHALERNSYTGREQFQTRLFDKDKQVVRGIGISTRFELEAADLIKRRQCPVSSRWAEDYVAKFAA